MEVSAQIIVNGLVQGVGFRYFVYKHAMELGLHGFVSNVDDGKVEIVTTGDRSVIEELLKVVNVGPRAAHVTNVMINWKKVGQYFHRFEIR